MVIVEGFTQYDLTKEQAQKLVDKGIVYYCGESLNNCASSPVEMDMEDERCLFYHLTASFAQDKHKDNTSKAFDEIDEILGRKTYNSC